MRKVRPRKKLYYSDVINDVIYNFDQLDYIQHAASIADKMNVSLRSHMVGDDDDEEVLAKKKILVRQSNQRSVENQNAFFQLFDAWSAVCPELCYMRDIHTQPLMDRFLDSHNRAPQVDEFMTNQRTLMNRAFLLKSEFTPRNTNLQHDYLLQFSRSLEESPFNNLSCDFSSTYLHAKPLSKLPQMSDFSLPILISSPSQLKSYGNSSQFSIIFNSMPRRRHKSRKTFVEKRRSFRNKSFEIEVKRDNDVINMSRSYMRCEGGHSYSTASKIGEHQKGKVHKWLEKKKETWRELSFLCRLRCLVDYSHESAYFLVEDIVNPRPSSNTLISTPSMPRNYFIYIDDKLVVKSIQAHSVKDLYESSVISNVQLGCSNLIKHIKPSIIPCKEFDERREIEVHRSIHSFFSYFNKQDDVHPKKVALPINNETIVLAQQTRLPSFIIEDSIVPYNGYEENNIQDVKNYLFNERSLPPLMKDIQRKRRLNEEKMPLMVLSSRSVLCFRTIGAIMSAYKVNGGVFIPHLGGKKLSFTKTVLSSSIDSITQDFISSGKAPSLVSMKRNRNRVFKPRKNASFCNLVHDYVQPSDLKPETAVGIFNSGCINLKFPSDSKSKSAIEYSHSNIHLQYWNDGSETKTVCSSSNLFDRFEVIQSIPVEVRGELLHLQTKSSDITRIGRGGESSSKMPHPEEEDASEFSLIAPAEKEDIKLHKKDRKRKKHSSKDEARKQRKMMRKRKEKKRTSDKKRKRKSDTGEKNVGIIQVPTLKVGATPMIITHAKYEVTSIQNEHKICRQQTFRGDVQVNMPSNREVSQVVLPNKVNYEVTVKGTTNVTHPRERSTLMTPTNNFTPKQSGRPKQLSKILKNLTNQNIRSNKQGYDDQIHQSDQSTQSISISNNDVQTALKPDIGIGAEKTSLYKRRISTHDHMKNEQLNLFCSEQFIENWSQAAAELSSGNWVNHILKNGSKDMMIPSIQCKIQLHDCILLDDCEVDIEFPDRTAIKIISFPSENSANASSFVMHLKSYIKALVNLASRDRYGTIHLILVFRSLQISQYLPEITSLQNAIIKQPGCPCDYLRIQYTQPDLLSSVIATISSKYLKTNILQDIDIDTRIIERARFLLSMIPTMTAFDCIISLSTRNVSLKDHIIAMSDWGDDSVVREVTAQQVQATMMACLKRV